MIIAENNSPAALSAASNGNAQFLTFRLAGETFGLSIEHIREILEYQHLTTVPLMPAFVRGVMNLRGAVIPVIDLSARLGRSSRAIGKRSCIVIIEPPAVDDEGSHRVGMLVDQVDAVLTVANQAIAPAPQFGQQLRTDFIAGMARVEADFIVLLDTSHVFSIMEMTLLATMDYHPHDTRHTQADAIR